MRKIIIITLALILAIPVVEAQLPNPRKYRPASNTLRRSLEIASVDSRFWKLRRFELTAGLGTTQFFGDLGGFSKGDNLLGLKDLSVRHTRFNIGAGIKYRVLNNFNARVNFNFGNFHATDIRGSNEIRGMESTTTFLESDIIGEFYFIKYKAERSYLFMKGRRNVQRPIFPLFDLYAFFGLGGISYNVSFNDLPVSGNTKTKGFSPVIPAGVGMNMIFSRDLNFGLELGGRYSFSDYLDGYTSQFSKSNDVYYFLNLTFTYKMKTGKNGLPAF